MVRKPKRREWTAEDVRELKQFAKAKTPAARIARKLKRTEGATRQEGADSERVTRFPRDQAETSLEKGRDEEICSKEDGSKKNA